MPCDIARLIPLFSGSGYRKPKLILVFLTICVIFLSLFYRGADANSDELVAEVPPAWLKAGTYAEYKCALSNMSFWKLERAGAESRFRWECTNLSDHIASLNFRLSGFFRNGTMIFQKNAIGYIDVDTRDLLYPNGTVIEKTALWLPPYMKLGEKVVVCETRLNDSVAHCFFSGGISRHTCQGYQEAYLIRIAESRIIYTNESEIRYTSGGFDMDTGLCIGGSCGYLGFGDVDSLFELTATNVDLGPRYLRTEILEFLWSTVPITVPTIVVALTAVVLYRKRRKRKKRFQEQRLKTQQKASLPTR
jgi:hypothetical protein